MNIQHYPLFDTAKVEKIYSEKDGVDVKYVCTTDLQASDVPVDIFYRPTPHPEFGNRYFGIFRATGYGAALEPQIMITNADVVESFVFGMVEDDNGKLQYSQSHHDYCAFDNGNMIDGGRKYIRTSQGCRIYKIVDGELRETKIEE